jgi:hypothetical protein
MIRDTHPRTDLHGKNKSPKHSGNEQKCPTDPLALTFSEAHQTERVNFDVICQCGGMNFFDFASSIRSPMPHSFQAAISGLTTPHPGSDSQNKDVPSRVSANEAIVLKLDGLERDLAEIRETVTHGNQEIEELQSMYEQLISSMEALFGTFVAE